MLLRADATAFSSANTFACAATDWDWYVSFSWRDTTPLDCRFFHRSAVTLASCSCAFPCCRRVPFQKHADAALAAPLAVARGGVPVGHAAVKGLAKDDLVIDDVEHAAEADDRHLHSRLAEFPPGDGLPRHVRPPDT